MEINYKQLNMMITKMNNQEFTTDTNNVATLSKKGQKAASAAGVYILELETEIENLKIKLAEQNQEIKTLKANIGEVEKLANAKGRQKDYIKEVESQLDRLPIDRKPKAKVKAIKFYVDMLLYYSNKIDSYNLRKSAAYGFGDKIDLINSLLVYAEHHPLSDNLAVIEKKKEKGIDTLDSITTTVSVALEGAFR